MRHLIVLSGNSLKNKAWGELMVEQYGPEFDSVHMAEYDHWTSGEANINFVNEEDKLRRHIATLPLDTVVTVFAKSAGSLLAILAINHGAISPTHVVFFGMPLDLAAGDLFKDDWSDLRDFKLSAIAFHNVDDPTTSYEFTKTALATHAPHIKLITTNESDHWYGDTATYSPHISQFLSEL